MRVHTTRVRNVARGACEGGRASRRVESVGWVAQHRDELRRWRERPCHVDDLLLGNHLRTTRA
eukprot:6195353-Pleurochrysis_carterae.AAC.1